MEALDTILAALEASSFATALKRSFYVYPLVNATHILAIGALVTSVLLMDLRLLGALGSVPRAQFVTLMRRVAAFAFGGAALTGLALFSVRAGEYAENPAFLAKLGLIALAGVNLLVFRRLSSGRPDDPWLTLSLFVSLAVWLMALIAGRFIGFV